VNRHRSVEDFLNGHPQRLGDGDQFIIAQGPLAALDLRNLRLIELDPITRQTPGHVLLRNLRLRAGADAANSCSGDIGFSAGFHEALDGAPILILFSAGIILAGTKMTVAIVKPSEEKPLAILCADDHTLVGDALMKVFGTAGYHVERASDGEEAWTKLSRDLNRFDVVITDHEMPRLTGLQLVGRLRDAKYPGRVIVYSAGLTPGDEELYRGMGVEAIVVKSPEPAKLLAVVKAVHRQE